MCSLLDGVFRRLLARPPAPPFEENDSPKDNRREARRPAAGSALLEWIDQDDRECGQAVQLRDQSAAGMGVRSPVPLDVGWPVLLTLPEGAPLKAVVRHRRRDSQGWVLGLQLILQERRRFDRRPLSRDVELVWQGPGGRQRRSSGRVRDVGEGGLQIACHEEIPVQTAVLLVVEGWQRLASIVHVQAENGLPVYGVQFSGPVVLQQSADFHD